jgi:hypothetical protein
MKSDDEIVEEEELMLDLEILEFEAVDAADALRCLLSRCHL